LSRLFALIFPKIDHEKTLGQMVDAFIVNTDNTIVVFKSTLRIYGALLAFQLLMGYGFEADIELLTKSLPKDKVGAAVDLSSFSRLPHNCARRLLEFVEPNKQTVAEAAPSVWTQTQAP
jgi:hypothetical protein